MKGHRDVEDGDVIQYQIGRKNSSLSLMQKMYEGIHS